MRTTINKMFFAAFLVMVLLGLSGPPLTNALVFKIDTFTVIKNGSVFFEDNFSDGLPPPSAPNFAAGGTASYITTGSFGPESTGKLAIDSDKGVVNEPLIGEIPFLFHMATFATNVDPTDLMRGLKIDDTFEIIGVFDLVPPTALQERYGIRVRDRTLTNIGDDNLELAVRRNVAGDLRIQFRRFNFITETFTVIASVALETFHNQIELKLSRRSTANNLIFASFAYIDGGVRGPITSLGSADIFRGENFTRAAFTVQKPAISSRFGPSVGSANPSGTFADPVNTATGNYIFQRTDLAVPGRGLSVLLTRTYNSLDSYAGPLGQGWTHTYNAFLIEHSNGSVTIKGGDGRQEFYDPVGDGTFTPSLAGILSSLEKSADGSFTVTLKSQIQYRFSNVGKLTSIT
ncbi:MAG: DUF6531 domain-containing protein, partial [Gammaproteobacteria bacterium]